MIWRFSLVMLMAFTLGGCLKNPFATRTSEQPTGSTGTWETPASPEVVVRNLQFAYNERNVHNFQWCLAEEFVFSAPEDSLGAEAQGSGHLYYGWTKEVEVQTTQNIFTFYSGASSRLLLSLATDSDNPDSIGDTTALLYRRYLIQAVMADSTHVDTSTYGGLAAFRLKQNQLSFWSIVYWGDLPVDSNQRWSKLKAKFRR